MPFVSLLFDEATQAAMNETALRLATGSAFAQAPAFHVPLLGSLHHYSAELVAAAIASAPPQPTRGAFVRWEIHNARLRAAVEIHDGHAIQHLQGALPLGKPWRTSYVELGSVAEIEPSQRDEFLAAVRAAFPMDGSVNFASGRLAHHNEPPLPKKSGPGTPAKLRATAKPFVPKIKNAKAAPMQLTTTSAIGKKKPKKKKAGASPHRKWERPTTSSDIDMLIKKGRS